MKNEALSHIDWNLFHFIRPMALWGIVITIIICALIWFANQEDGKWKKLIAAHLRPFVFTSSSKAAIWLPLLTLFFIGVIGSLALAGPTWRKIELSGVKTSANMVILLDASWSMMTEDIQPNRLDRAKLKINDLLDADPVSGISLYVYAGTTHTVLPNTTDYDLIRHNTESLTSGMMPIMGSDLSQAMTMMDSVFARFSAPSTLLLITDDIADEDLSAVNNFLNNNPHRIELLTMATLTGGEVPGFKPNSTLTNSNGEPIRSAPNQNAITALQGLEGFTNNQLTLDKSDVEAIAERMNKNLVFELEGEEVEDQWQDAGFLLLIPVLLLSLLFFRKGYMIYWCVCLGCFAISACSPDNPYAHLWYAADYRGQLLESDSLYAQAAEAYDDLQRKGIAFYKAGDFEAASALFAQDSSAAGHYNYGLTLTNLGRYEEAQQVFESVKNEIDQPVDDQQLDVMIQMLKDERVAADSINRFDPEEALKNGTEEPLEERRASSDDEELSSDTETDELPKGGNRVTDEVETNITKAEELERPPEDMEIGQKVDAQNIMLRAISADPAEFLRRRFKFQQEKYFPNIKAKQRH